MKGITRKRRQGLFARACYLTAIINSLVSSSYAQESTMDAAPSKDKAWSAEDMMHIGVFDVLPALRGGLVYDDNVYISSTNKRDDFVWSISPYVMLGAGDYVEKEESLFTVSYSPTFFVFTKDSSLNAFDHDAKIESALRGGSWTVGLNQGFKAYSGTVVDVGNRVDRQIYDTLAYAKYEISPKTSVDLDLLQSINVYDTPYNSFNEWVVGPWVDYWLTPKLRVGVGMKAGWVDVQNSANQTYQQGLARVLYVWSDKLEINASAGGEVRQYQNTSLTRTDPVLSLGASYKPLINTTLALEGYRRGRTSLALANQNYALSGVGGSVRQVIRDNYTLSLGAGYENLDYYSTQPNVAANRRDNYYFTRVGAQWDATDRCSMGVFYMYRMNDSTTPTSEFTNNQVGVTVSYAF